MHVPIFVFAGCRGLLIDSARHYISVNKIKRMIDGMSTMKLNILHWCDPSSTGSIFPDRIIAADCFSCSRHLTDLESFPVQSERYPLLSGKGAFCPTCVYTRDNLLDIVAYGALRGVRIMWVQRPAALLATISFFAILF